MSEDFDISKISISKKKTKQSVNVYYKGDRFFIKLRTCYCNHGIQNKSSFYIAKILHNQQSINVFRKLDTIARKVGFNKSISLFGEKFDSIDDVPINSLVDNGFSNLKIPSNIDGSLKCAVFNKSSEKIVDPNNELSNRFAARFLLSADNLFVNGAGKLSWNIVTHQIQIMESQKLPNGCLICETENELNENLEKRGVTTLEDEGFEVTEEELERNELID